MSRWATLKLWAEDCAYALGMILAVLASWLMKADVRVVWEDGKQTLSVEDKKP